MLMHYRPICLNFFQLKIELCVSLIITVYCIYTVDYIKICMLHSLLELKKLFIFLLYGKKTPLINKKLKNKFVLYSIIYRRIKERINLHMYTHNCLNTFF